jgi:hypothetical protein
VYSCLIANIALFGAFNPLLSAREIFAIRRTPVTERLAKMERDDPRGWLVTPAFPGAVLNGQGFRSIQHVLLSPQLRFFRAYFPEMPDDKFNAVFNRYAHIHLGSPGEPVNPASDVVDVPLSRFRSAVRVDEEPASAGVDRVRSLAIPDPAR